MRSKDSFLNIFKSSAGSPSSLAITRVGNSKVRASTRSALPSAVTSSINSAQIGTMNSGSQRASDFARNAFDTRLR